MTKILNRLAATKAAAEDAKLRKWLLREAEERGNAVIQVRADEYGPPYAFSVGAWRRFGVAEAVVIGLPDEMAPTLINAYVARAHAGERIVPGRLYEDYFQGVPVTFERVAKGYYPEFFGSAFLLYRTGDFPALQIIVPTPTKFWPWQEDAPEGFAQWQPILTESGQPESWTPGVDGP